MSARLSRPEELQTVAAAAGFQPNRMAAICRVSVEHLERHFGDIFKQTPAQWMRELRSHAVLKLLAEGYELKEIARILRFANSKQLSKEFRKVHYASPRKVLAALANKPGPGTSLVSEP